MTLALILFAFGLRRQQSAPLFDRSYRRRLVGFLAMSFAVPAAMFLLNPMAMTAVAISQSVTVVLLGWSVVLWPPLVLATRSESDLRDPGRISLWLGLGASFLLLTAVHVLNRGNIALIIDEALYVLQGNLFSQAHFSLPMSRADHPFFAVSYTIFENGTLHTQYSPGWPAVLAVASALGLRWWIGPLLGAYTVAMTYLLGRRLHSATAGAVAAALLGTQFYYVVLLHTYMSDAAVVPLAVTIAWILLSAEDAGTTRLRLLLWSLAGVLGGLMVAVRPLTGVALGASIWLWILVRGRLPGRMKVLMTGAMALGGSLPILALLFFNLATNGEPLMFGYAKAAGDVRLGFGPRGAVAFDDDANPVVELEDFTLGNAVRNFSTHLWWFCDKLPSPFMLVPTLFLGMASGYRPRWRSVAVFLILPAVHFFYYWSSVRFYVSLFPFVFLGVGFILADLWRKQGHAARYVLAFMLFCSLPMIAVGAADQRRAYVTMSPYFKAIDRTRESDKRILVFVNEPAIHEPLFWALYWYNANDFYGDVLVARDLGERNHELIERYPEYTPYRIDWLPEGRRRPGFVPPLHRLPATGSPANQ